ncbi:MULTISPECIES: ArsR/SmtB family transcription factor [Ralstonia solanacearum species complex]|uniref:ArsR/SmtB family transcription factor n=1 Tax=Ralstonia solanacearum species complex TaxID=3116862 RepID=UPI000E571B50|nr:winged helix-turn-helix domain-containing protein [Ralstonia solanacearum]BEU74634.1 helix-turn-helix transcriptional regulator [Ralstonia pseudosolanacearum]AXV79472.1 transcriptional regulator [Ralstonia solanacearum]AXV93496.1 transcriptional regulator [Ralstonia solanacearum]AXW21512.1 transcriptional regulator [Ralstonia solanacearum]AXW78386.1 transcriptional regulator [Ralstonia solanacearum]
MDAPAHGQDFQPDIGRVAATIGDPTRIRMLLLLMEGRSLTAKELAYGAGVEPATASAHLRRLEADALVTSLASGRYKYFGLRSPAVAEMIESLMVVAPPRPSDPRRSTVPENLRAARLCYDHLAGQLGTDVSARLLERGWIVRHDDAHTAYDVTAAGERAFAMIGIDVTALRGARRRFAYGCMDWSERRPHLAGALGAALAERCLALGWLARQKHSRALTLTDAGMARLRAWLVSE